VKEDETVLPESANVYLWIGLDAGLAAQWLHGVVPARGFEWYNASRPHQTLGYLSPRELPESDCSDGLGGAHLTSSRWSSSSLRNLSTWGLPVSVVIYPDTSKLSYTNKHIRIRNLVADVNAKVLITIPLDLRWSLRVGFDFKQLF
jgi:hypothetical protein